MTKISDAIPEATLETLARSFFKEAYGYGFRKIDYLRFVNLLLDVYMKNHTDSERYSGNHEKMDDVITLISNDKDFRLPIHGKRIKIRDISLEHDSRLFKKWLSEDYGRNFLLSCSTSHAVAFEDLLEDESNIICIVTLHDDTPLGSVAFLNYDHIQRKAELRKIVGNHTMRGNGLEKEAARLWIQYGIKALGLRKIYLNILDINIRNIKFNEDLGFRVEGILRNDVFLNNRHHDILRMGFLNQ